MPAFYSIEAPTQSKEALATQKTGRIPVFHPGKVENTGIFRLTTQATWS
jgi:hypothetical protein